MFLNNFRISDRQLKKMLVFDMISISVFIIPYIAASGAGRDGLPAVAGASVAAVCYGLLMLYFCKQIKEDYLQACETYLGRILTFGLGFLYLVKLFLSAIFVLTLFTTIIHGTILSNTGRSMILLCLIVVSVFYASKTMETRARMVEILYYIVLIPLFCLFLLAVFQINPANLFPLAVTGPTIIARTGYEVFLTFSAVEFMIFATPSISGENENSKFGRKIIHAVLVTALFNIIVFVIVVGLLGITGATQSIWSTVSVMQMIEIPGGFVHRQDAIMLSFWLISIFTITSTLFHYLCQITKTITRAKHQSYILIGYGILLFIIVMQPLEMESVFHYFGRYMAFIGLPQSVILPLLLIMVKKWKEGTKK